MKIICICGEGRSGSTLIAQLISQERHIFDLGQIRDIWRAFQTEAPCSCGRLLPACPIYGPLMDPETAVEMHERMRTFWKDAARYSNWAAPKTRSDLKKRHAIFLDHLEKILVSIAKSTGAETFVDASKTPQMALALDLLPSADVMVLNLVRDPRAVACSWHKKTHSFSRAARHAIRWCKRQKKLDQWAKNLAGRFMIARYEDFARTPLKVIEKIAEWGHIDIPDGVYSDGNRAHISWDRLHLYPPVNEKILAKKSCDIVISPSDEWKTRGDPFLRAIVSVIAIKYRRRFFG